MEVQNFAEGYNFLRGGKIRPYAAHLARQSAAFGSRLAHLSPRTLVLRTEVIFPNSDVVLCKRGFVYKSLGVL